MKLTAIDAIIVILGLSSTVCYCQTGQNVKDLLKQKFTTEGYNKKVRPLNDQSKAVQVSVDLVLRGINSFDEVAEKFTTTGYLTVSWTDEFLMWDSTLYGAIENIYVPQGDIWKPDIALHNGFEKLKELGSAFLYLSVDDDGTVVWYPYEVFTSKCSVNIKYFPFDEQTCHLKFLVWSYTLKEVNVTKISKNIDTSEMDTNGEWSVTGSSVSDETESVESTVTFSVKIKRKPLFYVLNIIIPIVMLSILNVFIFVLPAESGEKISFGITVFLAFAVFLTIVSNILPQNSEAVSLLAAYLIIQSVQSTLILIVTIIQMRLVFQDENSTKSRFFVKLTELYSFFACQNKQRNVTYPESKETTMTDFKTSVEKSEGENNSETDTLKSVSWKYVCETLDFFFFCFFSLSILLSSAITLGLASSNG